MSTLRKPTPAQHALGVTLSITVAFIWVSSSELIQYILGPSNFNRPFFLTFLTTSLFGVLLVGFLRPSWRAKLHIPSAHAGGYRQVVPAPLLDVVEMTAMPQSEGDAESKPAGPPPVRFNVRDVAYTAACIAPLFFLWATTFLT